MRPVPVVLCALFFVVAGCASDPETASPRPSATPSATAATVAPSSAKKLTDGKDYEVVGTLPGGVDGAQALWFGTDGDGTAYGELIVPDPQADPGSMGQVGSYTQPVLMSPDGKLTRMTPVRDSGTTTQMTGADADDRWVTWLESASGQVGSGLWTLFSYERATGTVRQLGSYRDKGAWKETGLDYDGRPEIVGDDVLVGMEGWGRSGKGSAVLSAPLDGSAPLDVLVPDATAPDVDAGGFSYLQGDGTLMYRDAATGTSRKIDGKTGQGECQQYRSEVLLTCAKTADGTVVRIAGPDGDTVYGPFRGVSYVELHDGWVEFVEDADGGPRIYAVDLGRSRFYEVSASQGDWTLMGHGYASVVQGRIENVKKQGPVVKAFQLIKLR